MPREPASRRRTVAERTDLAELREARRPRLSAPRAAAPAPKSPASDIGDMASDASGDESGSEASASGIGPAPPRARGRGRAGDGDGGGAHGDAAGAAPGGRGRGRRARGALAAPPVPRQARVRWGKPEWGCGETVNGWGADCRCHTNAVDIPGITTHCKKNMPYSIRHPVTASEGAKSGSYAASKPMAAIWSDQTMLLLILVTIDRTGPKQISMLSLRLFSLVAAHRIVFLCF